MTFGQVVEASDEAVHGIRPGSTMASDQAFFYMAADQTVHDIRSESDSARHQIRRTRPQIRQCMTSDQTVFGIRAGST